MATDDSYTWEAYRYNPSMVLAIIAIVLFGLATITACYQLLRGLSQAPAASNAKRQIYSVIPFILGGVFEIIGYIGRALSHNNTKALRPYIIQAILLLVAPALFAATIYMSLARIIVQLQAERFSIIPVRWLTKLFVLGDIISFFLQAAGGGIQAGGSQALFDLGKKLIVVGLFVQIAFFGLFIAVLAVFYIRITSKPTCLATDFRQFPSKWRNWVMVIATLFSCSILIFIRSIVRVVEYLQGNSGTIISHEAYLYALDGLMMLGTMIIFNLEDISLYYSQSAKQKLEFESHAMADYGKTENSPLFH